MYNRLISTAAVIILTLSSFIIFISFEPEVVNAGTAHAPILIEGDGNFTSGNGVTGGSGTAGDPYIIEGWDITVSSKSGIEIKNTTMHFVIRGVVLNSTSGDNKGIVVTNVSFGRIESSTVRNFYTGLYLAKVENLTVKGNTISDGGPGIIIDLFSTNNDIISNNLTKNSAGIFIEGSNNNIVGNNISNNYGSGIELLSSPGNNISNNNILNNSHRGIILYSSHYNNISFNKIFFHINNGVELKDHSNNNSIYDNEIVNNTGGFFASFSNGNTIEKNYIYNNMNPGISIHNSMDNIIVNNNLKNNGGGGVGISFGSDNNEVISNEFYDNSISSISIYISANSKINQNTIYNSTFGISIDNAQNITLTDNSLFNSGLSFTETLEGLKSHSIDASNDVNTKPIYYWKNKAGGAVPSGAGQVVLVNCSNVTCENQNLSNATTGVLLFYSKDNIIQNNYLNYNHQNGIHLLNSDENNLYQNTLQMNGETGIVLQSSTENRLENNLMESNQKNGIYLYKDSNTNDLENNTCSNNIENGIMIQGSSHNYLSNNTCDQNNKNGIGILMSGGTQVFDTNAVGNTEAGLMMEFGTDYYIEGGVFVNGLTHGLKLMYSDHNKINENIIESNNNSGISLISSDENEISSNSISNNDIGIDFQKSELNLIYYNNFIDNTDQVLFDQSQKNFMNSTYPGGNYWSDYQGVDEYIDQFSEKSGRDGIGDKPHVLDANHVDHYPLMKPWGDLPSAPKNLHAVAGDLFINLSWELPENEGSFPILGYKLHRGPTQKILEEQPLKTFNISSSVVYFNDTSVDNGLTYFYNIETSNWCGASPRSNVVSARPGAVPGAPVLLWTKEGDNNISLSWMAPDSDGGATITNYLIYRGPTPGEETLIEELGDVYYYTDTNVTPGVTYYYMISARNAFGIGNLSERLPGTIVILPGQPINVKLRAGDSYINLTWEPPVSNGGADIEYYHIYRVSNDVVLYELFKIGGDILFYNDTSVSNDITYFYTISAVNSKGEGVTSIEANGTPRLYVLINLAPTAKIIEYSASDATWRAPVIVTFYGSGTDSDGRIVSYYWDFGDGHNSTAQNPTHTFTEPGKYIVKLYVYDDDLAFGIAVVNITVEEGEQGGTSGDKDMDTRLYLGIAGAAIALVLVIIILIFLKWPMVLRRKKKLKKADEIDLMKEEEIEE
ncbi:MAG: right-handed parallel beta-helix repeat-containing protein [Thermoplasmata archaeon]|nr:MAG: right-handed parallel beta-helix repeat-containing protein [Thermoplasmata archaeon]